MSKLAVDYLFTDTATTSAYPSAYNPDAIGLGDWISKFSGATLQDRYCGPQLSVLRPMEASASITVAYPHVVKWSSDIYHVFAIENSSGANTRRLMLSTYTKSTGAWAWNGYLVLTPPAATAHTAKGLRMILDRHTAGTVSVSGTAVTGSGTTWLTSRAAVGSRIGFGSTDPSLITEWLQVTAMASDSSITLGTASTTAWPASTPYVLEEYLAVFTTTNATATNGGVHMVRGLNKDLFTPTPAAAIPSAVSTDLQRAVYWLKDAATVTNVTANGLCVGAKISATQQFLYVINGTASTIQVYKYNFRAPLTTVATGASTNAFVLATGSQVVTGTISSTNNGRLATLNHGVGLGIESLYFVTTTRIYRVPTTSITSGNVSFLADSMAEVPIGGTATFPASGALSSLEVMDSVDRILILGGVGGHSYVSSYRTDGGMFEYNILANTYQTDQSSADSSSQVHPNIGATAISAWSEDGLLVLCRNGSAASTNIMYAFPNKVDFAYTDTTKSLLVSPRIPTPNAQKLGRIYLTHLSYAGGDRLGLPTEPFKTLVRTSGISDDSGAWTAVPVNGDISGVAPGAYIQVAVSFRTLGWLCVPARIVGFGVSYEDTSSLSNFQFSSNLSSSSDKRFAWRLGTAFGGTVPNLRISIYDAQTGGVLLTDTALAPASGVWDKSVDGGLTWGAYDSLDKTNATTYIRFTPDSLADNVVVRPTLTLA